MAKKKSKTLRRGDEVEWKSPQGKVQGVVEKKVTGATRIKGHEVQASKDEPQFVVKSKKTGAKAAHKGKSLKKK